MYVLKFRGAGQGTRALVAEVVAGELGRALGLPVPELVFGELDAELARTEPDPEIHALIHDSAGLNLGMDYLPGSVMYDSLTHPIDPDLASRVVWFDAFISNVDRTVRNTNMLLWHRQLWLIDHGASLYFHHSPAWDDAGAARPQDRFPLIKHHVLLPLATRLREVSDAMAAKITSDVIDSVVSALPDTWLTGRGRRPPNEQRADYVTYLTDRLRSRDAFVEEALGAR
jgi:hypothetical protein